MLLRREHKYVNKECNLINPYLLTAILSIPINKLSWMLLESATEKVLDQIDRSLLQVQAHWSRMTEKSFQNYIWKVEVDNLVHIHIYGGHCWVWDKP